jgi:acetoin utilization protein AcuB
MNLLKPVSTIMSTDLLTVDPEDNLKKVAEIFENKNIHHIPVVRYKKIVGLISKTDFNQFSHGYRGGKGKGEDLIQATRLETWKAKDIMTKGLAKVDSKEPIRTAIGLFKMNRFHAIPIVDDEQLVGIVTTFDIIDALAIEPISLSDYQKTA